MSGWKRIALICVAIVAVIGGGAYYWLIAESHMPSDAHFALDMDKVRQLAEEIPGDKVLDIRVEKVGRFEFPATAVVAGDGWATSKLPVFSYQLVYPDGTTGIIDTGISAEQGGDDLAAFDKAAFDRMTKGLGQADFILVTHEHVDHIGGLAAYPDLAGISANIDLTQEQIDHPERSGPATFSKDVLGALTPVVYDDYKAIAPGVVLIKAAGHSPGSQMVYVRKVDGTEVLFLGDVAWHVRNIETLRERARLVTQFFLKEDRHAVFGELKALNELRAVEPKLIMLPGHDGEVYDKYVSNGVLTKGFE
jgi:glyoxylase-like metal-dependent hydrolase (beta-lactamase superfamily II)